MPSPFRPRPPLCLPPWLSAGLAIAVLPAWPALAQAPIASSYSTRDGRIVAYTMACISTDGSYTAKPCGVPGYPLHVTLDGGTQSSVTQSGPWAVTVNNLPTIQTVTDPATAAMAAKQPALNADGGALAHIANFPATQAVTDPATAAMAAKQPALNADGGALAHIANFPVTQAVTDTATVAIAAAVRTNDAATVRAQTHDDQLASVVAKQPALNADGGAAAHITNFPAVMTVTDTNSAAFQGVVAITPGAAVAAQRSLGFVMSVGGSVTLTLADGSTITLSLPASAAFQTLPFAVTNVALGNGAAGSFWNLK